MSCHPPSRYLDRARASAGAVAPSIFARIANSALLLFLFVAVHATPTRAQVHLLFGEESDGAGDYVEIDDAPTLDLTTGAFTISAWIMPSGWGQNNQGRVLDHGGGSGGTVGWSLALENKSSRGFPRR